VTKFVYIDESHFDFRTYNKRYGYFVKGARAQWPAGNVTRNSFSLIMAQSNKSILHHYIRNTSAEEGGIRKEDFISFLEELLHALEPDSILILDNARIHRANDVLDFLFDNEIPFLFLPPYSPDYNPIELSFGYIKNWIQENEAIDVEDEIAVAHSIERAMNQLTEEILTNNN
jgi:transposase